MRILVLLYQGVAEFEVTLLGFVAREEGHEIATAAPDDMMQVRGMGGFRLCADLQLSEVNVDEYDALIVPGGPRETIIDREEVSALIRRFHGADKLIGAICAAPVHLAKAGVLAGRAYTTGISENYRGLFDWSRKVDRPVVFDGNIVTARAEAFVGFTFAVLEKLGVDVTPWRQALGA